MLRAADYRARAREALKGNWGLAVGTGFALEMTRIVIIYAFILIMLLTGVVGFNEFGEVTMSTSGEFIYMVAMILVVCVNLTLLMGYLYFNLNLAGGGEVRFDNIFARFNKILKISGLYFMVALFTMLWWLLLIIPGIIASFRYVMAPYIIAENPEIGILEAITKSKEMMKGYKWKYFCLQFSFFGWALLGVLTFGIGMLWITPYMQATNAAFYLEVSGHNVQYEYDLNDE